MSGAGLEKETRGGDRSQTASTSARTRSEIGLKKRGTLPIRHQDLIVESHVHGIWQGAERKIEGAHMLIGAGIAGLLIVSLFLEMISSSPKAGEKSPVDAGSLTPRVK